MKTTDQPDTRESAIKPHRLDRALEMLDQYLERRLGEGLGPGMTMALTDRQRTVGVLTHGVADVATQTPVTPDTMFQIGSISKAFTAAALMRQHEAGRLDLSAAVTRYLDWFEVQSAYDDPITIHHLLTHTAGLVCMIDTVPCSRWAVWKLRDTTTGFAPGTHFHYSNLGYRVLGFVLEELTGRPFAEAMRAEVLEPLRLMDSAPTITHELREHMALGYSCTHYDDRPAPPSATPFPTPWFEFDGGSGSVACTPTDLAKFLRMLLNRGQGERGRFLTAEAFDLMTRPAIASSFEGYAQSYGLLVGEREEFGGHQIVMAGGEMIGYETAMIGDMTDGIGVITFVNSFEIPWSETNFALKVLQAALREQDLPEPPPPKAPLTRIENADEYAGIFRSHDRTFELVPEGDGLVMHYGDERIPLELWWPDAFYVPHPDFKLAILRFGRVDGVVVEGFSGGDWYRGERYDGPVEFDHPGEWNAYVGHYRTYSPWMSNFRAFVRKGHMYLLWWGVYEQPLTALEDGSFRVGHTAYSPERLRFDSFADGRALRAILSGGEYYRVETA